MEAEGDVQLDRYAVTPLLDTEGTFVTYGEAFPGLAGAEYESARSDHASLFRGSDWWLPFRAYLLRSAEHALVVDLAVGPPPNGLVDDAQGLLPEALRRAGLDEAGVELIFLTHLHIDHVGWVGRFPNARYVVHEDDWASFSHRDRPDIERLRELERAGRLELIRGGEEIAPGLQAVPTIGHTPGHTSLRVGDAGYILGDVAVHPAQLAQPSLTYAIGDGDPEQAAATRRRVLAELADEELTVAACHFPGTGLGRIVRSGRGYSWESEGSSRWEDEAAQRPA